MCIRDRYYAFCRIDQQIKGVAEAREIARIQDRIIDQREQPLPQGQQVAGEVAAVH